jgi:hypothetical protein
MANLQTTYLKLPLKNPLIVGASPLSGKLDNLKKMEEAGRRPLCCPHSLKNKFSGIQHGFEPVPAPV